MHQPLRGTVAHSPRLPLPASFVFVHTMPRTIFLCAISLYVKGNWLLMTQHGLCFLLRSGRDRLIVANVISCRQISEIAWGIIKPQTFFF